MSTTHEGASDMPDGDDNGSGAPRQQSDGQRHNGGGGGGGGGGDGGQRNFNGSRRNKRRQRPQRAKRRNKGGGGGGGAGGGGSQRRTAAVKDDTNRERIYQDIEGLLRRIREEAEESSGHHSEDELREITATVTDFTKLLDEESEVISERARAEYHRVREKLNHAIRT